jgi:hypothetical protein
MPCIPRHHKANYLNVLFYSTLLFFLITALNANALNDPQNTPDSTLIIVGTISLEGK